MHLIAEIAAWEADHPPEETWSYYRCWARALESLLNQQSAVRSSEIETRVEALAQRPHEVVNAMRRRVPRLLGVIENHDALACAR